MQHLSARQRFQRGSLFLRGNRWVIRYREDVMEEGQVRRRILRSVVIGSKKKDPTGQLPWYPTQSLAWRSPEIKKLLNEVNSVTHRPRFGFDFAGFARLWIDRVLKQHKPSTQVSVQSHIRNHLNPFFGEYNLREIDAEMVQEFISSRKCAPKTVTNLFKSLRMMWRTARAWGYVSHNPLEGVVLAKVGNPQRPVFTLEEMRRIIAAAREPYQTIYWIASETGLRAGELLGLRVSDLDLKRGLVAVQQSLWRGKVQQPKTENAVRLFALSDVLVAHLTNFLQSWCPNELNLLFTIQKGNPIAYDTLLQGDLQPLLQRLGIRRCGMHAFRHGNATMMDRIGVPMKVRQQRLGHADESMTRHYTHIASEDDRACAERLGQLLFPGTQTDAAVQ